MEDRLLQLFTEFYEKQDIAQKQTTKPFIHAYGHSDLHCIDIVGSSELPNVTMISNRLNITRGAASKITKRLMDKGDMESYQQDCNRKEVYFTLTEKGREVYEAHRQRHEIWRQRDMEYLRSLPAEDKEVVARFLEGFNGYLERKIADMDEQ